MMAVRTFFRHCPSCGHRFEIRLISKREVGDEGETNSKDYAVARDGWKESDLLLHGDLLPTVEVPVVEVKELRYNYICRHCGHEWSEKAIKTTKRPGNPDYRGD